MGASVSRESSTINTGENLLNQSDFKEMQSMTTNSIMNTIDNIKKSCAGSAQATQNAGLRISGLTIGKSGNVTIGNVDQRQTLNSNLGCIQKSITQNTMANKISDSVQQHINNKFNAHAQTQIANMATAHAHTGFLPLLSASVSSANSNTKTRVNTQNIINTTLSNIVNNTIQQTYTDNDFESCIGNMISAQNSINKLTNSKIDGNVEIGNTDQDQTLYFKQKCVQDSDSISKTLEGIVNNFNTISKVAAEAGDTTKITAHTTSDASTRGIADFFSQFKWIFIIIGIVIVVIIIAAVFLMSRGGPSGDALNQAVASRISGTSIAEKHGLLAEAKAVASEAAETALLGGGGHSLANAIRQLQKLSNMKTQT